MQRLITTVLALAMLLGLAMSASVAAVPRLINYQGVLTDASGAAIDGTHNLTFKVYADSLASSATWTEVHTGVALSHGVFNVILGGVTPFSDALFADSSLWLGTTLDTEPETAPRMRLTSVPWAMRAALADVVVGGGGDPLWETDGTNVYLEAGNVGLGTPSPSQKLEVNGNIQLSSSPGSYGAGRIQEVSGGDLVGVTLNSPSRIWDIISIVSSEPDYFAIRDHTADAVRLAITENGKVGIGTRYPEERFEVAGNIRLSYSGGSGAYGAGRVQAVSSGDVVGLTLRSDNQIWDLVSAVSGSTDYFAIRDFNNQADRLTITTAGNVGINTHSPEATLDVRGRTKTQVLEITGADLVESFDTGDRDCEAGTVVVIDSDLPGNLRMSSKPYDSRVAGVVSGAGDLPAGILMGVGSGLGGNTPVAMTGRVYGKCTTENGPVMPGDRLTTSTKPGHAMKATDWKRSPGAVIGKAMTALEAGEGLVLVLVNLQ